MLTCVCSLLRSKMTSKCGKEKKVANEAQPSVSWIFLPNLVRYITKLTHKNIEPLYFIHGDVIYAIVLQQIISLKKTVNACY